MSSASVRFGTKAYVCARYFLRPGKCFKYMDQCGEDATEHVYEVIALYPYCVLLRDTRNGVRTSLPERKEYIAPIDNVESQKDIIAVGWNACIDAITKEVK